MLRSSGAAADRKSRRLPQKFRSSLEQIKMRDRLAHQQLGLCPRPLDAEDRDEGGFSGAGVDADRLSGLGRRALDIEEIVGDLKGEPQIMGIAAQRQARLVRRLGENRPGLAGKGDQARRSSSAAAA